MPSIVDVVRRALSRAAQALARLLDRLPGWIREHRAAIIDLVVLGLLGGAGMVLLVETDLVESFYEFSREHEDWQLDDFVLAGTIVVSICATIFSTRRWREVAGLLRRANTDALTGLLNRRRAWEILELEWDRSRRYGRPLSLIMFDLDHFKEVNDRYGHDAGDQVLKVVAASVQSELRATDAVARWGGEEFMIVCVETDIDNARPLAERLRTGIEACHVAGVGRVTASFGVAQISQEDKDIDALARRVDDRLYAAKDGGRNCVR